MIKGGSLKGKKYYFLLDILNGKFRLENGNNSYTHRGQAEK